MKDEYGATLFDTTNGQIKHVLNGKIRIGCNFYNTAASTLDPVNLPAIGLDLYPRPAIRKT